TLKGDFEYPHLIVPVDSAHPEKPYGTSYFGQVSSSISSIFNFDIPVSYTGKSCSLIFFLPPKGSLETSDYNLTGPGAIGISALNYPANDTTTYNNKPSALTDLGEGTFQQNKTYTFATFSCPAGSTIGFELSGKGDTSFTWFQDYNPQPIGLYITVCKK
ncbi:MAG: hypothetical protein Q9157_009185, partial [Trypethelium eluteriae]